MCDEKSNMPGQRDVCPCRDVGLVLSRQLFSNRHRL